jgi:hypothetical protein
MNLPPSWNRMGFTAKAGYLCASHQARNYEAACAMLRKPRRKHVKPSLTVQQYAERMEKNNLF